MKKQKHIILEDGIYIKGALIFFERKIYHAQLDIEKIKEAVLFRAANFTKGAGLIQLTGDTQKQYLKYLPNNISATDPDRALVQQYYNAFSIGQNKNGNPMVTNQYDVAQLIANNYAIESASWFWGTYKKPIQMVDSNNLYYGMTIDSFIERHKNDNEYNTFAATQCFVNGGGFSHDRLDEFCGYQ